MKGKITYFIVLVVFMSMTVNAQTGMTGSKIPIFTFQNSAAKIVTPVKIPADGKKITIIDFWATWCSPCIKMLPTLDSLQKIFEKDIQFISVSSEPAAVVKSFFKNRVKDLAIPTYPCLYGDTVLRNIFTPVSYPFYVWLDANGKILAKTDASQLTVENFKKILRSEKIDLKVQDEQKTMIDKNHPAFILSNPVISRESLKNIHYPKEDIQFYSIYTKYIPSVNANGYVSFDRGRFSAINVSILFLYQSFFGLYDTTSKTPVSYFEQSRNSIQLKDSSKLLKLTTFIDPSNQKGMREWFRRNGVCYEAYSPTIKNTPDFLDRIRNELLYDFERNIGINVDLEKKSIPVYELGFISPDHQTLLTKGGAASETYNVYHYSSTNQPLSHFIGRCMHFFSDTPYSFVDSTKYGGKVDFELNCKMTDIVAINKELEKYGLRFTKKYIYQNILIIKDIN